MKATGHAWTLVALDHPNVSVESLREVHNTTHPLISLYVACNTDDK